MMQQPARSVPVPTRHDFNSACSAVLPAQATPLRSTGGKSDCASNYRASMQTGSNTSPGLFVSEVAGSLGGEMTPFSFHTSGASFKRSEFVQTLIDIAALIVVPLYLLLWIAVILGLFPFTLFCLFLVSFH